MARLPRVMVAPNGARRTKADHPRLPITIDEIVSETKACLLAGATGLHAHVRDDEGRHSLDPGRYRELLSALRRDVPKMRVQVTTESAGVYSPADQRALLRQLRPSSASVAIREMLADGDELAARNCYHDAAEAGTEIQHILYDNNDLLLLKRAVTSGTVPASGLLSLLVLGRYDLQSPARLGQLAPRQELLATELPAAADHAVCAFGPAETEILLTVPAPRRQDPGGVRKQPAHAGWPAGSEQRSPREGSAVREVKAAAGSACSALHTGFKRAIRIVYETFGVRSLCGGGQAGRQTLGGGH